MFWVMWAVVGLVSWLGMGYFANANNGVGGAFGSLIANLLGSWLGTYILGSWGLMLFGFGIIQGLVGAIVISYIWNLLKSKL